MEWMARWIWLENPPEPTKGSWVVVRKTLDAAGQPRSPRMHITADSRYVLWVNGERVGRGPIRSWPQALHYDTYDLTGKLVEGRNEILVLVMHHGVGTFQYIPTRGGLLAQIEWEADRETIRVGSDESWQIAQHPGYDRRTPRISCQQAWVEHFDARATDVAWEPASVLGPAGMAPWTSLVPRPIPFLTDEPLYPVRVQSVRRVRPPEHVWAVDLRPNLLPGYLEANRRSLHGFLATVVHVDAPTTIVVETQGGVHGKLRVNGQRPATLPPTNPWARGWRAEASLHEGDNLLMVDVTGNYHEWSASYVVEAPVAILPQAPLFPEARFATLGPEEDEEIRARIWAAATPADLEPFRDLAKPIAPLDEYSTNVLDLVTLAEPLEGAPRIEGEGSDPLDHLCAANGNVAVFQPDPDGADIEVILDLGRMTVGYLEFELESEPGVTLDCVGLESIQEGVLDYTWDTNIVMRYTTTRGHQRYTSVVRRGLRYLNLTIRGLTRPLKLKTVRQLLNTYPVVEKGSFLCDDWALNRIWEIGQYTTRLCSEDTYVDCPTYEQTFWVGDSRNESLANFVAFGAYELTRHSLRLVAPSLERSALAESQVPSAWQDVLTAWSFLWVLACEEYYQHTGDRAFLEEIYPVLRQQGLRCESMLTEDGLLYIRAWNMLDWAPMDTPSEGIITHQNGLLAEAYRRTARIARVLGRKDDERTFQDLAVRVYAGINAVLWEPSREAYIDCIRADGTRSPVVSQQTNAVLLLCDCVPAVRIPFVRRLIVEPPEGVVRAGSPFILFFILEAYAKMGMYELMVDAMTKHWRWMIDRDATTCWETFPGWETGGRWTRSHCHAWSAAPTYFLSAYQLGVTPAAPGFTEARIAPQPTRLRWARGRVPTPHGEIYVEWTAERADWRMHVSLPRAVAAKVIAPKRPGGYSEARVDGTGDWSAEQDESGLWRVSLGAGATVSIVFA